MKKLIESTHDTLLEGTSLKIIKFYTEWCAPCKILNPILVNLESSFKNVEFYECDIETNPALSVKYKIRSLPTMVFIKDSAILKEIVGMKTPQYIEATIRNFI